MVEFYKMKRLICLITAFILCFGFAGCGDTDRNQNPVTTPETPQIEDTDIYLVQNGNSDYKVVVDDGVSSILLDALRDLILFIREASGAKLELKYQSSITYSSSSKLIVFGCDTLSEAAGVSLGSDALGDSGYRMVTKDRSVFVMAQSVYGLKNGAYDFLSYQINWEIYSADMIYYAKSSNFLLKKFNISNKPDFEFRRSGDLIANDARRRMKLDSTIFAVDNVHTGFIYLPKTTYQTEHPNWYADNGLQLCFTAHGNAAEYQLMQETILQNILVYLDKNLDVNTVIIGQEDESRWCDCDECTASFAKYKTDSAVMVKFTNDISERLENYYRENNIIRNVKFCVFSYQNTVNAPVIKNTESGSYEPIDQSVVCRDNVGVYYAPCMSIIQNPFIPKGIRNTANKWKGGLRVRTNYICFCTAHIFGIICCHLIITMPLPKLTVIFMI